MPFYRDVGRSQIDTAVGTSEFLLLGVSYASINFSSTYISLTILRLISVISPLLGLLGTVLGITRVFREISLQAAVDNAALAGGIWEALITTIMGLTVAIPTLVFYYLLRLRTRALTIETIEAARDLMRN